MGIGLLMLRLVIGLTMAAHGLQKLFGWFGGHGLEGTGKFLETVGFVPGKRNALMAGLTEAGGGLLLALGLATPVGGMLVFSVMVVAAVSSHLKFGFFIQNRGYEFNVVLGFSALSLAFIGPGRFSLDTLLGCLFSGRYVGLGALALGLAGAAVQLATRKVPPAPKEP